MKLSKVYILLSGIAIFFACDRSGIDNEDGELISHTLCKNEKMLAADSNQTCVEYSYNAAEETLSLKHINTAFNCCPDKLYCNIRIENDTIFLEESERKQDCLCMCLYDMEAEVYGVKAQSYTVKYDEPYLGDAEELVFEIDLQIHPTGTYCVERTNYPWGI
jgi:hypothetical protein